MTKKKRKTIFNKGEIFHLFANGNTDARSKDYNLYIEKDCLYYYDTLIAKIINKKKKIVAIKNFEKVGSYGNGYSCWTVQHAFSEKWTKIIFEDDIKNLNKIDDTFKIAILKEYSKRIGNEIKRLNDVIYDKKRYNYYSLNQIKDIRKQFQALTTKFNIPKRLLNKKCNERVFVEYCQGWSSYYEIFEMNNKYNYYLYKDLFTKEEYKILEDKNFIHKYFYGTSIPSQRRKDIINNETLKKEFLDSIKKAQEEKERLRKEKEKIEKENAAKELIEWKNNKRSTLPNYVYSLPVALRLENDNETVKTSMNATITLQKAKLLYSLFNKCKTNNTTWVTSSKNQFKIGYYRLEKIIKNDNGSYCLIAGCHNINENEIEDFVKRYNLNWK